MATISSRPQCVNTYEHTFNTSGVTMRPYVLIRWSMEDLDAILRMEFQYFSLTGIVKSCDNVLTRMPWNFTDDKSALVI